VLAETANGVFAGTGCEFTGNLPFLENHRDRQID
jgi:hypothetical protein